MPTVKGMLLHTALIEPKTPKGATHECYSAVLCLPPGDPAITVIKQVYDEVLRAKYPTGLPPKANNCWDLYESKFGHTKGYDPRLNGWMTLSMSASADDKPELIDTSHQPLVQRNLVASGMICHVAFNITAYSTGQGGMGAWLNGVMATGEEGPFGRLDGRPSVEQMFAGVPKGAMPVQTTAPAPAPAPAPMPSAPQYVMTPAAQGFTRDQYVEQGWNDAKLVEAGLMMPPAVTPSFG